MVAMLGLAFVLELGVLSFHPFFALRNSSRSFATVGRCVSLMSSLTVQSRVPALVVKDIHERKTQ